MGGAPGGKQIASVSVRVALKLFMHGLAQDACLRVCARTCPFKALPDSHHERPSLVPKTYACVMGKYACMRNAVYILLSVSIKYTASG